MIEIAVALHDHRLRAPYGESNMRPAMSISFLASMFVCVPMLAQQNERDIKVRGDKATVEKDARWIYNDLPKAYDAARDSGKPMLVVFRCIPCVACSQFDELVVKRDERIQKLMDEFICVRVVQTNGLDLSLFQFDYDQSFHAVLMNADKAIYGRYGTRSANKEEFQDMTMEGFAEAMQAALDLHKAYPGNAQQLAGKKGGKPEFAVPEQFPSLKQYGATIDYVGATAKSCIHCHQIRDADREHVRSQRKLLREEQIFPYPLPETIGLKLDPKKRATVLEVADPSPAKSAGLQAGDEIREFGGQPITSIADIQWVLHHTPARGSVCQIAYVRGKARYTGAVQFQDGWRAGDISWRPTTWELRAMALGGMKLKTLTAEQRKAAKLPEEAVGLVVEHLGWYGEHARAKNAGMEKGDIILFVNERSNFNSESALIAYLMQEKRRGDMLTIKARRGSEDREVKFEVR
jgi:serine protease Do